MSKLAQNYPQLRIILYALIVAALGGAVIAGWITEDQSTELLTRVSGILGAIGLLLAMANVPRGGEQSTPLEPVEYKIETPKVAIDVDELAAKIGQRWDQGVQSAQQALAHATRPETVADIRRRAEQALGYRVGE